MIVEDAEVVVEVEEAEVSLVNRLFDLVIFLKVNSFNLQEVVVDLAAEAVGEEEVVAAVVAEVEVVDEVSEVVVEVVVAAAAEGDVVVEEVRIFILSLFTVMRPF